MDMKQKPKRGSGSHRKKASKARARQVEQLRKKAKRIEIVVAGQKVRVPVIRCPDAGNCEPLL